MGDDPLLIIGCIGAAALREGGGAALRENKNPT